MKRDVIETLFVICVIVCMFVGGYYVTKPYEKMVYCEPFEFEHMKDLYRTDDDRQWYMYTDTMYCGVDEFAVSDDFAINFVTEASEEFLESEYELRVFEHKDAKRGVICRSCY